MSFEVGDLIWAKMKGYPPWPAKIAEPEMDVKLPKKKKPSQFVYFFGSKNYAWITEDNIIPHSESVLNAPLKKKSKQYQQAIDEMMNESTDKPKDSPISMVKNKEKTPDTKSTESDKDESDEEENDSSMKSDDDEEEVKPPKKKKSTRIVRIVHSTPKKRDRQVLGHHKSGKKKSRKTSDSSIDEEKRVSHRRKHRKMGTISVTVRVNDTLSSGSSSDNLEQSDKESSLDDLREFDNEDNDESSPKIVRRPKSSNLEQDDSSDDLSVNYEQAGGRNPSAGSLNYSLTERNFSDRLSSNETSGILNSPEVLKPIIDLNKKFGFIGLGELGEVFLKDLVKSGMNITMWVVNAKEDIKQEKVIVEEKEVKLAKTPAELIQKCDITLCCCDTDTDFYKDIIFGENGILKGFEEAEKLGQGQKGFVGLNSIDNDTSTEINNLISIKYRGLYLEAPVVNISQTAGDYKSIVLASGDRELFTACEEGVFRIIARKSLLISCEEVNLSSKMKVIFNAFSATMLSAMHEMVELSKNGEIMPLDLLQVAEKMFKKSKSCAREPIIDRVYRMSNKDFNPSNKLKDIQKYINRSLSLANSVSLRMPVSAAANEVYKHAERLNYSDVDAAAIYKVIKY